MIKYRVLIVQFFIIWNCGMSVALINSVHLISKHSSIMSLLNKVSRVLKCPSAWLRECPSSARVSEWPSSQVPWVPECPSALWVPEFLKCSSAQVPWMQRVQVPFKFPRSDLFRRTFQENFSEYLFYITLTFLGNKICKFSHVLIIQRCFKSFSLYILQSSRKVNMMESGALFLLKL